MGSPTAEVAAVAVAVAVAAAPVIVPVVAVEAIASVVVSQGWGRAQFTLPHCNFQW